MTTTNNAPHDDMCLHGEVAKKLVGPLYCTYCVLIKEIRQVERKRHALEYQDKINKVYQLAYEKGRVDTLNAQKNDVPWTT